MKRLKFYVEHPVYGRLTILEHSRSRGKDEGSEPFFVLPGGEIKTEQQMKNWCWSMNMEYEIDDGEPLSSRSVMW